MAVDCAKYRRETTSARYEAPAPAVHCTVSIQAWSVPWVGASLSGLEDACPINSPHLAVLYLLCCTDSPCLAKLVASTS
jgi:hypothetical protein